MSGCGHILWLYAIKELLGLCPAERFHTNYCVTVFLLAWNHLVTKRKLQIIPNIWSFDRFAVRRPKILKICSPVSCWRRPKLLFFFNFWTSSITGERLRNLWTPDKLTSGIDWPMLSGKCFQQFMSGSTRRLLQSLGSRTGVTNLFETKSYFLGTD